jgi:hypothetical protein
MGGKHGMYCTLVGMNRKSLENLRLSSSGPVIFHICTVLTRIATAVFAFIVSCARQ